MPGAARYFTWQTLRPAGPESCDTVRPSYAGTSVRSDALLSDLETREGYNAVKGTSQLVFLAVELLADQAGPEAVISYYASLRPGTTWQEAFQDAFGMTVAEFYELFEERRAVGFPRPRCPTLPPLVTLPGSPEYMKWEIGSDVRPEYIEDSVEGVRLMHEYGTSLGMPEVEAEFTAHLYYDQKELITAYEIATGWTAGWVERGSNAVATPSRFFTNTLRWEERSTSSVSRKKITAHELFHVFEQEWSGNQGPTWLTEGSAEFFAFKAMDAGGLLEFDAQRNSPEDHPGFVNLAKDISEPLCGTDADAGPSGAGTSKEYAYYLLAVELLAAQTSEQAVIRYFLLLRPGSTWQEAFTSAFGMPVEDFCELFEEHRAAGFPEVPNVNKSEA